MNVLRYSGRGNVLHLAILGTCKLIHVEFIGALYSNPFTMSFGKLQSRNTTLLCNSGANQIGHRNASVINSLRLLGYGQIAPRSQIVHAPLS